MSDCGVYRITCVPNGRVYIGSSLGMRKRFSEHRTALRYGRHHSLLLQRAWNKYGEDAFSFERLLRCSPEMRHEYEQRLIDGFDAANPAVGMNRAPEAKGRPPVASFKGRKHSEASRRLMSERLTGRPAWNKGGTNNQRGMTRSAQGRANIAAAKREKSGKITMEIARAIRDERARTGAPVRLIAAKFDVPINIAYRVIRGISWKEIA